MKNYITGNYYTGQNADILSGIDSDGFLTFLQAKSINRVPTKGTGIELKRVITKNVVDEETGEKKVKKTVKRFYVFRIEDTTERQAA